MSNNFFKASSDFARRKASQSAAWAVIARDTVSGFVTTAHHTLMLLGLIAIGALGVMFFKPDIADQLKALSPFAAADTAPMPEPQFVKLTDVPQSAPAAVVADVTPLKGTDQKAVASSRQQQWVTDWLSKRYRVAADATNMLVSAAYLTAKEIKLDPLLILSVMAIESGFNPFAESPVGAQGLMQVMSKVHRDKFAGHGGVQAALNPVANIRVGSLILKDYVTRGGSIEAGLKLYVGAGAFDSDSGYGAKVLAEYRKLKEVAMGKKVPVFATSAGSTPAKPQKPETPDDSASTSGDKAPAPEKNNQIAAL